MATVVAQSRLLLAVIVVALLPFVRASALDMADDGRVLHVYSWADTFDSVVINDFQKKHSCEVRVEYFDSNEELYEEMAVRDIGYDVIIPSSYMAVQLWEQGLLMRLDHRKVPNLRHLHPNAAAGSEDVEMRYSAPFIQTITGIGYNKETITDRQAENWNIFANPISPGGAALLDDMRETLGAALLQLGFSANSVEPAEIEKAGALVQQWMRSSKLMSADDGVEGMYDGKYDCVHAYNGDIAMMFEEMPNIGFAVPAAGAVMTSDVLAIPATSPVPELAHAFINHLLDPVQASRNMNNVKDYMPNPEALARISPELAANPAFTISDGALARTEMIRHLGAATSIYEEVWAKITAP